MVVRTVTTLTRLLDILSLIRPDRRIQLVFTYDAERPAHLGDGVEAALRRLNVRTVGWEEATKTAFDLALAASENDRLSELDAPILLFPHGIGYQKYYPGGRVTSGMDPEKLLDPLGEVVPAAIALSHEVQREQLRTSCPEAAGHAVVVGDPCHDRMALSTHRVRRYREALGTGDRKLVVVASTFGKRSLYGGEPELPQRLLGALPYDEFQVALVLHPGVTAAHSEFSVHGWETDAMNAGLVVIPPDRGWQATILAADCVISDEGSSALYAAAVDKPLLAATSRAATTVAESPLAMLIDAVPALGEDLRAQIETVMREHRAGAHRPIVERAVESPGQSASLLRELIYGQLALAPPAPRTYPPVLSPEPPSGRVAAFVAGLLDGVLVRFPAAVASPRLEFSHVVAHADDAELHQLDGADVVFTDSRERLPEVLAHWPLARLAAAPSERGCLVRHRDGSQYELDGDDAMRLASEAYLSAVRRP
ncbi:hypothetical protein AB5J62_44140 [Amycolatopsis sp. cg5]|uniref:hypothetical protein n=1 Tax=Amycolatopsis sp. cg5 TaxID=3238802 RepID=UPI0035235A03